MLLWYKHFQIFHAKCVKMKQIHFVGQKVSNLINGPDLLLCG